MCDKQKGLEAFMASKRPYQYLRIVERDWDSGRFSESYRTASGLDEFGIEEAGIEAYDQVVFTEEDGVLSWHDGFQEAHLSWVESEVVGKQVIAYAPLESEDSDLMWAGQEMCFDMWIASLGAIPTRLDLTPEQREELDSEIHDVNAQIGVSAPGGVFFTLEAVQGMIDDILAETVHGA